MTQAEQLAAQAAQWQAAGRTDMAVQLYVAALEQDPSKFAIRMQLAECLAALGQLDPAAEHYLGVAQAYAARGRQQECLAICERVLAIAPHAFVYMTVGPMVRRIGRQARPVCARAAEAHLAAGRQTDGLQMLRLGAELDPHNPDVRRQLARIYQSRHMKREAVEALSDAGNLLLQAKRYDDYVEVAEQILGLEPREIDTLRELPRVYLELRRPHEAVRTLGQLTKASPGDIVGYEILAQAFAMIGRVDKSLSVLERLVEQLGATGRADKADAILNHARYWRPSDAGFMRSLKRMEVPRPAAPERSAARTAAPEGTVVLSIADLLVQEGSTRAPVPGRGDVQLTEAEGTLTLRLDDLILDEMQQAAGRGVAPTKPPPGNPPPPPARRSPLPPLPRNVAAARGAVGGGKPAEGAGMRRELPPLPKPGELGKGRMAPPPRRTLEPPAGGMGAAEGGRGPRRVLDPSAESAEPTLALQADHGMRRPDATAALGAGSAPPGPSEGLAEGLAESTMALDASDLLEAIIGASPKSTPAGGRPDATTRPDGGEETELLASDGTHPGSPEGVSPTLALQRPTPEDEERTTLPPPPRAPAPGRSMSDLIYDDDDGEADTDTRRDDLRRELSRDEEETETLLHMRPLTAADIARAMAQQAAKAQAAASTPTPPRDEPVPPPSLPSIPFPRLADAQPRSAPSPRSAPDHVDVDAPGAARHGADEDEDDAATVPPPLLPSAGSRDDAPTLFPTSARLLADLDDDASTVPPPPRASGMGDEAPTLFATSARLLAGSNGTSADPPPPRAIGSSEPAPVDPALLPFDPDELIGVPASQLASAEDALTGPLLPRGGSADDAPTVFPTTPRRGPGEEAPTVARLTPLSAADIARALLQGGPTPPTPPPVRDDETTVLPLPASAAPTPGPAPVEPEQPPLLPPLLTNDHEDEEEDEDSTITMTALRPEDLLRGPNGRSPR